MSLPVVVFPDVEQLVVGFLAERLGDGVRVGTVYPEDLEDALPVVAVNLLDLSDALDFVLEDSVVDIDVLAADKGAAHDLAQLVRAHLKAMPGVHFPDARVYRTGMQGFVWAPDEVTEIPRYVLTFDVRVRPL